MSATKRFNFMDVARMAMPLMDADQRAEAEQLVAAIERTGNAAGWFARVRHEAAKAFETDMIPARAVIIAALHDGGIDALRSLRGFLPGLLHTINDGTSELAVTLARAMAAAIDSPVVTFNAAEDFFSEDPVVTDALKSWRKREVFETDLGSAELRGFSQQLRNRSLFSARTTNAEYLKEVAHVVDEILSGNIGMTEGRIRLMRKLKELGYDPMVGFPQDMANIPPAERGSLQDLSSERRIDLLLETNVRMAQGYAQEVAGNGEYVRYAYPAYELVRLYKRVIERGSPESKSPGWESRWEDAGDEVNWEGALREPMMALKDSPIWQALGDGAGGYTDTLLNPFPPYAFRSGKGRKAVSRERAIGFDLIGADEKPAASTATLTPGQEEVKRILDGMPADLRAELERELAAS